MSATNDDTAFDPNNPFASLPYSSSVLTPAAGVITPTATHHHVAAGTISSINTTLISTNGEVLLLLTADGAITITLGATIVGRTTSLAVDDQILYELDGGSKWREVAVNRSLASGDIPSTLTGKTLVTPTIASFINAQHNHSAAASGGNIPSSSVTGLAPSATTDTTNASNITSGTLPITQLPVVTVPKGGTGIASLTAYAPLFGGTNSTNPIQSGAVGSAGQLLTSNGASALPTFQAPYSVYAPAPSGGDDYATIQGLINTYNPTGVEVVLRSGAYLLSAELAPVAGFPLRLRGVSNNYLSAGGTTLQLTQTARSCIAINTPYSHVSGIKANANSFGTYAFFFNGSSFGRYEDLYATNAKLDGIYLEIDTGSLFNDTSIFDNCWSVDNGTIHTTSGIASQYGSRKVTVTGTATVTAGSATITIVTGTDMTTVGIRKGDFIRTGSGSKSAASTYAGQIQSFTSTTIVLAGAAPNLPLAAHAGSGLQYAISTGNGVFETGSSNNNINIWRGGLFRSNAGAGISIQGLFGDTFIGPQADGNAFYSYAVGQADNVSNVFGASFVHPYSENDGVHADFFLGNCTGLTIVSPTGTVVAGGGTGGNASIARGQIIGHDTDDMPESIAFGTEHNFIIQVEDVAGTTIKHRIVSEVWGGNSTDTATRINGPLTTYSTTPTISNIVAFTAGAGIYTGTPSVLVLDTPTAQYARLAACAEIVYNDTGTALWASLTTESLNVNGVTLVRPSLRITDINGNVKNWNTTTIPSGKSIAVQISGRFR